MVEELMDYETRKEAIRLRKAANRRQDVLAYEDVYDVPRSVGVSDVLSVGSKVLIGGGVGLLAGIAAIVVTASAAEIILAGVVTKIAGVVGGALGLTLGLSSVKKNRE
jgi:hypothetical protein